MKLKLLLTFDYELYFGENYFSESKVLFETTIKLLEIAKKHNVKLVFFVDIVSIIGYRNNNRKEYIKNFKEQIKYIKSMGHDMQMHFHPHWIDSKYDDNTKKWNHKYDNWSYSNLINNFGLDKANNIFSEAHELFIEVTGYKPIAFRAGGYSIQPYQKELLDLLMEFNYKFDSSIVPYRKFISDAQVFNFLECENLNYWNCKDSSFLSQGISNIIEIPLLSVKKNLFNNSYFMFLRILNKFSKRIKFKRRGKGATLKPKEFKNNSLSFSFDMVSNKDKKLIKFITKQYIKQYKHQDIIYLNILSHPKAIFDESLNVVEWYIQYMKKEYDCNFIGFDDMDDLSEK